MGSLYEEEQAKLNMKKETAERIPPNEILQYQINNHPHNQRYQEWKMRNPLVFKKFEELSLQLIEKGRRFGIGLLAEKIRWDYYFDYNEEFKIQNTYRALIVRELILLHPEMRDLVSLKQTKN